MVERVRIVAAAPAQVRALAEVWCTAQNGRLGGAYEPTVDEVEAIVRRRLCDTPGSRFLAAVRRQDVVGMGVALSAREDDGAGPILPGVLHVSMIAVVPDQWRRGIGTRILSVLLEYGKAAGFHRAHLWTQAGNARALALYESIGFERNGRTKRDERNEDIVQLVRPLT